MIPSVTAISPFYLYTILRTVLATGLMTDAQHTGTVFQVQRTLNTAIASSHVMCTEGTIPMVYPSAQRLYTTNPDRFDGVSNDLPFSPPPLPPALPPRLPPPLPVEPSPTYEWFAVQLRWVCSVLCYFAVVTSMISKRLSGVLAESAGYDVAEVYEQNQKGLKCVESLITCVSLLVYVGNNAYELYLQFALSAPPPLSSLSSWSSRSSLPQHPANEANEQLFVGEIIVVCIAGSMMMCNVLVQYCRCNPSPWNTPDTKPRLESLL